MNAATTAALEPIRRVLDAYGFVTVEDDGYTEQYPARASVVGKYCDHSDCPDYAVFMRDRHVIDVRLSDDGKPLWRVELSTESFDTIPAVEGHSAAALGALLSTRALGRNAPQRPPEFDTRRKPGEL